MKYLLRMIRKASRSGRAACFGARPHHEGCELAAIEYERMDVLPVQDYFVIVGGDQ